MKRKGSLPTTTARTYRCVVSDANGNKKESLGGTIVEYVGPAFEITKDPEDCEITLGQTVVFEIETSGSDLTYQWQWRLNDTDTWKDTKLTGYKLGWNPQKTSYEELCRIMAEHDLQLAKKEAANR